MTKKKLSILIVDDNDMMRSVLRSLLRGDEYDVVGEAGNGQVAVSMVERLKPDLVCMDVVMPEKNGIEALSEIKAAHPKTEVIMVTSSADMETVHDAIHNGASGYIIKPFNAARVFDTLASIAEKIRARAG